ncbi:unnamed protein product [Ectocarpus sp. CCAP 1310/34]|nr:unnamed protein product [Ectocarpus sp. CCAP 1310/34]
MEGLPERGRRAFWGPKAHPKTTPVVKEGPLPRQHREYATAERAAMDEEVGQAVEKDNERVNQRIKRIMMFLVVALVVSAIVDIACHDNVRTWLETSFEWIEDNPKAGVVVFALLFCLSTLLFVPGLLLTIGAGVAFGRALGFGFGVLWGSVAVLLGAVVACVIAFYLGRYVLHEQAQSCAKRYRILSAVNTAIERNGVKVMILLRLSPLVPFSGFNFIAGLTKVSLRDYLLGTVGIVPGTLAFVYIGASTAGTMNEQEAMNSGEADRTECIIRMATLIVGAVAAVLAIVAVTIYARRALKQALVESELDANADKEEKAEHEGSATDVECGSSPGEFKEAVDSGGSGGERSWGQ